MPRRVVRFDPYANRYAIFFREISRSYGFSQPNPKKNCFGLLGEKSSKTHKKKREIRPRRLTNQCRPSFKGEGLKKKTGHSRILRDPFQSSLTPNAFWKQNIDIPAPCDCAKQYPRNCHFGIQGAAVFKAPKSKSKGLSLPGAWSFHFPYRKLACPVFFSSANYEDNLYSSKKYQKILKPEGFGHNNSQTWMYWTFWVDSPLQSPHFWGDFGWGRYNLPRTVSNPSGGLG